MEHLQTIKGKSGPSYTSLLQNEVSKPTNSRSRWLSEKIKDQSSLLFTRSILKGKVKKAAKKYKVLPSQNTTLSTLNLTDQYKQAIYYMKNYDRQLHSQDQSYIAKFTPLQSILQKEKRPAIVSPRPTSSLPHPFIRAQPQPSRYCLIRSESKLLKVWNLIVMTMVVCNLVPIVFVLGLGMESPRFEMAFDKIIDIALFSDVIVKLLKSYYNQDGDEVFNRCKIAKRYMVSPWFVLDLLIAFPFDLVLSSRLLVNYLRPLKFLKLRKIPIWINIMNLSSKTKKILKLMLLIVFILILVFTMSAIWIQVVNIDCFWFPIIEQINPKAPKEYEYCRDNPRVLKFLQSWYYTNVMILSHGEAFAQTISQDVTSSLFFLLGSVIDALLFGMMAHFTQLLKEEDNRINERQDKMRNILQDLKIPKRYQQKMLSYALETSVTISQHQEFQMFMDMLSPSVKSEVIAQVCKGAIRNSFILQTLEYSDELKSNFKFIPLHPEEEIYNYGDESKGIFFVIRGEICIQSPKVKHSLSVLVKFINSGGHFGEVGTLLNTRRCFNAKNAARYSLVAFLQKSTFIKSAQINPEIKLSFMKNIKEYNIPHMLQIKNYLCKSKLFTNAAIKELYSQIFKFRLKKVPQGSMLWKPGIQSTGLIVILKGFVTCLIKVQNILVPVACASKGQVIGLDHTIFNKSLHLTYLRAESNLKIAVYSPQDLQKFRYRNRAFGECIRAHYEEIFKAPLRPYPIDINFVKKERSKLKFHRYLIKNGTILIIHKIKEQSRLNLVNRIKVELAREQKHKLYIQNSLRQNRQILFRRFKEHSVKEYLNQKDTFVSSYMRKQRKLRGKQ